MGTADAGMAMRAARLRREAAAADDEDEDEDDAKRAAADTAVPERDGVSGVLVLVRADADSPEAAEAAVAASSEGASVSAALLRDSWGAKAMSAGRVRLDAADSASGESGTTVAAISAASRAVTRIANGLDVSQC
jgi:hypothetical protein